MPPSPPVQDIPSILSRVSRPSKAVVTAGMPYANGPLHLGHLAGAHVPADVYARWMGMVIGRHNVLFVCGTDDHGSTSEVAAMTAGVPIREFIDGIHVKQEKTLAAYSIGLDVYSGTSSPECFPLQRDLSDWMLRRLKANGLLTTRTSMQWYDPEVGRFLPDRLVRGKCPNPKCDNTSAYSDECGVCGKQYEPTELIEPRSALSSATPVMKETAHAWLDMWAVSDTLRVWIEGKAKTWRQSVMTEVLGRVLPSLRLDGAHEAAYKALVPELPKHKFKWAPGKALQLQFGSMADYEAAKAFLAERGLEGTPMDGWAHRAITRDVVWGIPVPDDLDPALTGKTLYVWPDSLIAPISFSAVAKGGDTKAADEFWRDPNARVYQFLGQDNVYFYVLMQGALWLGTQEDPHRLPVAGELQLTDVFGCAHLLVEGQKMSKSVGNFITGDELLERYTGDQVRYYLSLLGLPERSSNFERATLEERNRFLAGPMNAAFERPISACHSKFGGRVPDGVLLESVVADTAKIVQRYVRGMERAEYWTLLNEVENYARSINSLFNKYKPHDDRFPEDARRDALYSAFYVLKTLMIMLYPFVPGTMEKLRESLRLPADVFSIDQLGTPIPAGHEVGEKQEFFPPAE
jgi:methionyl-tRNA synthetase